MDYVEYSKELNSFSFNCNKETLDFIEDETKERVLLGRLYYALVHYYFSQYPEIASSSAAGKHETLLRKIEKEESSSEYILFKTMKSLREWADYHPLNQPPMQINKAKLFHQVNRVIN